VLVLLLLICALGILAGILLLVIPNVVRRIFEGTWESLQRSNPPRKLRMINTPTIGGIGMIVMGIVIAVILLTHGASALQ